MSETRRNGPACISTWAATPSFVTLVMIRRFPSRLSPVTAWLLRLGSLRHEPGNLRIIDQPGRSGRGPLLVP
jgi:hypothetical protein